jgi:hypothetical protein
MICSTTHHDIIKQGKLFRVVCVTIGGYYIRPLLDVAYAQNPFVQFLRTNGSMAGESGFQAERLGISHKHIQTPCFLSSHFPYF